MNKGLEIRKAKLEKKAKKDMKLKLTKWELKEKLK